MVNFTNYKEFQQYIETNYPNEEDQIVIENFISYYINKYRKLRCCEITYKESIEYDITGELHSLGLIGYELSINKYI